MAVRNVVVSEVAPGVKLYTWTGLLNTDTGEPARLYEYGDATVTLEGTFGAGGTIAFQGSNDLSNFYTLTDPQGNAISKTAAGIECVIETPLVVRPNVTAGDGSTNLECRVLSRRTR